MRIKVFLKLLVVCLSVMMMSCHSSDKPDVKKILASDSISIDMTMPTLMELYGNYLLIGDILTEGEICTLYDVDEKKVVTKFGRKGHSNDEFMHLASLQFSEEDDTLYVYAYDPVNHFLRKYDISEASVRLANRIKDDADIALTELFKIDNGFLATGLFTEGKFALLNDSLKGVNKYVGNYLQNKSGNVDQHINAVANYGKTVISSDKKHLASIVYLASEICFYDIDGNQLKKEGQHVIRPLNYECKGDDIINKDVMGYLSASYGNQSLYALYSGLPEKKEGYATYGSEIQVFDLKGNLKKTFRLEHPAFVICVDKNEKQLYAMTHEPNPIIYIYDIAE